VLAIPLVPAMAAQPGAASGVANIIKLLILDISNTFLPRHARVLCTLPHADRREAQWRA
jgi:hypothetical protein